ncbi:MAG: ribosomal RNA small subunit methyltransferase A [Spirochaetales bacterium]|nr:ribosomal RNA small subunit methyltransferase A [Spirochaetales bacterium]
MKVNYDSPADIAGFLKEHHIWLKKRFGQNFLVNPGARKKLADLLDLSGHETVWEVGPGIGSLTAELLPLSRRLKVFEIDRGLSRLLRDLFPAIDLVEGDVLKTWKKCLEEDGPPDRVIGNLPYSSGAAILISFIQGGLSSPKMVFTVQREQALRMAALPGSKDYSSFSVVCSSAFRIEQAGDLHPGSFFPRPEVMSRIVVLTPREDLQIQRKDVFYLLVRDLFHHKRKTIKNNLEKGVLITLVDKEALFSTLEEISLSPKVRPEDLSAHDLARWSEKIGTFLPPAKVSPLL